MRKEDVKLLMECLDYIVRLLLTTERQEKYWVEDKIKLSEKNSYFYI